MQRGDGVHRDSLRPVEPQGRAYWDHTEQKNHSRYTPVDRGGMEMYRGIWIYYTRMGWNHTIDVMGKRVGFQGTSKESVYAQLDAWMDGRPVRIEQHQKRPQSRTAMPLEERLRYIQLPLKPVEVSDKYAYWNSHKKRIHVTVGVSIDGRGRTVFGGYYDDWTEAHQASIRACIAINNEIARRSQI